MSFGFKIFVFIGLFMFTTTAFAQIEGNPENWCRNGLFPREGGDYSIGVITAKNGERVYFYSDDNNCPGGTKCRQKSYLIAKNEVIVSGRFGNFACSWYQPKNGSETVGWIPIKNLEFTPLLQGIEEHAGTWKFYDSEIQIKLTKQSGVFEVKGNAFWKGLGDNIHIGELDGTAKWNGKILTYGEDDNDKYACKVKFDLVWKYLIVSDNLYCGGLNVTFSGVYTRRRN